MRTNCLFWAYKEWKRKGGSVLVWKSHYGWWWHFGHRALDGTIRYFYPDKRPHKRRFPPLMFKGHVVEGDYSYHKVC